MYPGIITPKDGFVFWFGCENVTLPTPYVASMIIVHFLFVPSVGLFTSGLLVISSYATNSSGHYPALTYVASQSSSMSSIHPSLG